MHGLMTSVSEVLDQIYRFVPSKVPVFPRTIVDCDPNDRLIPFLNDCFDFSLQDMLGADQAYEGLYGQGPPSVHSSHGGRMFQQGT